MCGLECGGGADVKAGLLGSIINVQVDCADGGHNDEWNFVFRRQDGCVVCANLIYQVRNMLEEIK